VLYSVYDVYTGLFTGARLSGDADFVARNTPLGMAVLVGEHDHRRVRIDPASGELRPYQPPRPSDNELVSWEWDAGAWRWTPKPTMMWKLFEVRERRNTLLAASDWTALSDVSLSPERREQWRAYRQALRDITDQADSFNIVWPEPPT
jgi:hypothetical protein